MVQAQIDPHAASEFAFQEHMGSLQWMLQNSDGEFRALIDQFLAAMDSHSDVSVDHLEGEILYEVTSDKDTQSKSEWIQQLDFSKTDITAEQKRAYKKLQEIRLKSDHKMTAHNGSI
jgi:hypothetical protein